MVAHISLEKDVISCTASCRPPARTKSRLTHFALGMKLGFTSNLPAGVAMNQASMFEMRHSIVKAVSDFVEIEGEDNVEGQHLHRT